MAQLYQHFLSLAIAMNLKSPKPLSFSEKLLRNGVFLPAYVVGAIAMVAVMCYITYFHQRLKLPLSGDPATWGAFGDFIGGVLNPLCAYMAFIWLVRSYALQKTELAETRATLEKSQAAQQAQSETALHAARLNALSIRMQALSYLASFELTEMGRLSAINPYTAGTIMYDGTIKVIAELITEKQKKAAGYAEQQADLYQEILAMEKAFSAKFVD